jgi:hypothetical protein
MKSENPKRYFACPCLGLTVLLNVAFALGGCGGTEVMVPAAVQPLSGLRVAFDSFVSVNYGKNHSLYGCQTTQTAIETTLQQWYGRVQVRQTVVDGTPADLQRFLLALPGPEECDISVVYLGSIQNTTAGLEFVNGDVANWRDLLAIAVPPVHPCRIVVLDVCNAAVVRGIPAWERFGTETLLASGTTEKTYQFIPSALVPINVQKYSPPAWAWAQTYLPSDWSRHISFLGLIWIETVAKTHSPPADKTGWTRFFDACSRNAATFRRTASHRWASDVQAFSPASEYPSLGKKEK